jgi:hypothetical protein
MTERIGYEVGVPCWVDTWRSNADAAVRFYTRLFGWEADGAEGATAYFTCTLRRRAVAGIGRGRAPAGAAAWTTYVWVASADETVARVVAAGGRVVRLATTGYAHLLLPNRGDPLLWLPRWTPCPR